MIVFAMVLGTMAGIGAMATLLFYTLNQFMNASVNTASRVFTESPEGKAKREAENLQMRKRGTVSGLTLSLLLAAGISFVITHTESGVKTNTPTCGTETPR